MVLVHPETTPPSNFHHLRDTTRAAYAPVLVASLGFLSFGLPPPSPEWGVIIAENRALLFLSPATALGPGLMLASLVIGINLTTEGAARLLGRRVDRRV